MFHLPRVESPAPIAANTFSLQLSQNTKHNAKRNNIRTLRVISWAMNGNLIIFTSYAYGALLKYDNNNNITIKLPARQKIKFIDNWYSNNLLLHNL